MMWRVGWLASKYAKANRAFDPVFCVKVLTADTAWLVDAFEYMRASEAKMEDMITRSPQRFNAFRTSY
jgi:hypothetical protein